MMAAEQGLCRRLFFGGGTAISAAEASGSSPRFPRPCESIDREFDYAFSTSPLDGINNELTFLQRQAFGERSKELGCLSCTAVITAFVG